MLKIQTPSVNPNEKMTSTVNFARNLTLEVRGANACPSDAEFMLLLRAPARTHRLRGSIERRDVHAPGRRAAARGDQRV
jgi:hypothetical protein